MLITATTPSIMAKETPDDDESMVAVFGEHVAAVKVPALHELVPDTVYPELHVGVHEDPLSREFPHGDITPFAIVPVEHLRVLDGE